MPIHISGTGSFIPKNKVDNSSFANKLFFDKDGNEYPNSNDEIIKVGYGFNDKRYNWVNRFGEKYLKYYPGVYVRGREYDYILMRSHNLKNNQEGIQNRSIADNDYIITYNISNPPLKKEKIIFRKNTLS